MAINGFVQTIRKQRKRSFAAIGDGTSLRTLQAVLQPEQADGYANLSVSSLLAHLIIIDSLQERLSH